MKKKQANSIEVDWTNSSMRKSWGKTCLSYDEKTGVNDTALCVLQYPTESVDEDEDLISDGDEQVGPTVSIPLCLSAAAVFRR